MLVDAFVQARFALFWFLLFLLCEISSFNVLLLIWIHLYLDKLAWNGVSGVHALLHLRGVHLSDVLLGRDVVQLLGKRYTLFIDLEGRLRVVHLGGRPINFRLLDAPQFRVFHLDFDGIDLLGCVHVTLGDTLLGAGFLANDLFHVVQLRLFVLVVEVVVVVHELGALAVDLGYHLVLLDHSFVLLGVRFYTVI